MRAPKLLLRPGPLVCLLLGTFASSSARPQEIATLREVDAGGAKDVVLSWCGGKEEKWLKIARWDCTNDRSRVQSYRNSASEVGKGAARGVHPATEDFRRSFG